MTSIYQYNRNTTNATGSPSNKATSNARGRTESPSMRARHTRLASGTANDSVETVANRTPRTQQPPSINSPSSRNPPERISANPAQSFSKVNAIATSYLNKTGLVNTTNLTPRRYKVVEAAADTSKTAAKSNLTKSRLNEFGNHMQQGSNNLSSKPQKYLSTYSNLNQMQNHHNSQQQQHNQYTSNGSALEDDFANSLYLNHNTSNEQRNQQTSGYNIITHETADTNNRYSHQQSSMGNSCAAHGSLLRAAQSKQVPSSQFYPAQQQQQQQQVVNGSYKIPTIPSNSSVSGSSSNSSAAQHSYFMPTAADVNSNVQQFEADNHELTYKGIVGLKNLGNTVSLRLILPYINSTFYQNVT